MRARRLGARIIDVGLSTDWPRAGCATSAVRPPSVFESFPAFPALKRRTIFGRASGANILEDTPFHTARVRSTRVRVGVGYNAGKTDVLPFIVFQQIPRIASFFLLIAFGASAGVWAQTAPAAASKTPPAESAERVALQRGQESVQGGDLRGARSQFEKAVKLAPNDVAAQSALGWVLAQQGEFDSAAAHLKAAIKAKPGFVDAHLTLASVLAQQGKLLRPKAKRARR